MNMSHSGSLQRVGKTQWHSTQVPGKPSLNKFALLRLMTVERATDQLTSMVVATKTKINVTMKKDGLHVKDIEKQLESKELQNAILREQETFLKTLIAQDKRCSSEAKVVLDQKRAEHQLLEEQLKIKKIDMEERRKKYQENREMFLKINALLLVRRKQLINEISFIYPLKSVLNIKTDQEDFSIFGFVVPNADEISIIRSADEEKVATGLGYTAHILLMISQFLDMPLRFPIIHCGSRSQIHDHITKELLDRDRNFPLHSKGKEKFLFNYGVFLLNKNIAQLRHYCGMATQDLRNTLPNLHSLLEQRLGVQLGQKPVEKFAAGLHSLPDDTKKLNSAVNVASVFKEIEVPETKDQASSHSEKSFDIPNGEVDQDGRGEESDWLSRNPQMTSILVSVATKSTLLDSDHSVANSMDEEIVIHTGMNNAPDSQSYEIVSKLPNEQNLNDLNGAGSHSSLYGSNPTGAATMFENIITSAVNKQSKASCHNSNASCEIAPSQNSHSITVKDPVKDILQQTKTSDVTVGLEQLIDPVRLQNEEISQLEPSTSDGLQQNEQLKGIEPNEQIDQSVTTIQTRIAVFQSNDQTKKPVGLQRPSARTRGNASRHSKLSMTVNPASGNNQVASRIIAETFSKTKINSTEQDTKKLNLVTNTNFKMVDSTKRVISDD